MNNTQIHIIISLILIFLAFFLKQSSQQCTIGCKTCNSNDKCIVCDQNYSLIENAGQCNYKLCEKQLFKQVKQDKMLDQQNNCQSVCDFGFWKSQITNLCEPLHICSQQYVYNPPIDVDNSIKEVIDYDSKYFLVIYQSKVNILNKSVGQLEISIQLDANTLFAQIFEGQIFQFKDDNTLSRRSIYNSEKELYNNQNGKLNQMSKLVKPNEDFLILSVYDNQSSTLYLSMFFNITSNSLQNKDKVYKIQLEKSDQLIFLLNYLFIGNLKGIKILLVEINDNIKVNNFTNGHYCSDFWNFEISQVIQAFEEKTFIIISKQSNILAQINSSSCKIGITIEEQPKQITSLIIKKNYLYILNLQTSITIYSDKFIMIQKLMNQQKNNLIDSMLINVNQDYLFLAAIFDTQVIQFYQYNSLSNKFEIKQSFNLLIKFIPLKIVIIDTPQPQDQMYVFKIAIYNKEMLTLIFQFSKGDLVLSDQYFVTKFGRKDDDIKNLITSIDYNVDNDLISACSQSGKIISWDSTQVFNPQIIDQSILGDYGSCKNLKYINDHQVLVQFEKSILIFNMITQTKDNTWVFQSQQLNQISKIIEKQGDYLLLLFDSCLFIYNLNFEKIAQNCSTVFEDTINYAYIEPSSYNIIIQKYQSIIVFSFDINQKKVIQKAIYTEQSQTIQLLKVRSLSQQYQQEKQILYEIIIYKDNQSFIVFDDSLNILFSLQNIPITTCLDIKYVDEDSYDTFYFIQGITTFKVSTSQCQIFAISKVQKIFYLIVQQRIQYSLIYLTKKTISINSALSDFELKICFQLNFVYCCQTHFWNTSITLNYIRDVQLYQNLYYSTFIVAKNKQYYILGDQNGFLGINYNRQQFETYVFLTSLEEIQSKDYIKQVVQSFKLGKYFVIKSNILVFNLFTNEFIEKIDVFKSTLSIQKFNLLPDDESFICLKNNIILIKNYKIIEVYTYKQMTKINGYVIQNNLIYIFGSQISKVDFTLTQLISPQIFSNQQASNCYNVPSYLICQMSIGQVQIYYQNTLEIFNTIISQTLDSTFQISIDITYSLIMLYTSTIEIYSFSGILVQTIKQPNGKINEVTFFEDIMLYRTSSFAIILDRISFDQRGSIKSAGGGTILQLMFLKEHYHLVMTTDTQIFGQIFTYNLQTFQLVTSFKNAFTLNEPSIVVDIGFDREQNYLIYLDVTGNFQQIKYSDSYNNQGSLKLPEYSTNSGSLLVGFSIDFNTNNLFIYSQTQVINVSYGEISNTITMIKIKNDYLFAEINDKVINLDEDEDVLENISYIIVGENGILYRYYQTKLEYYYHFSENVLQVYYSSNSKNLIIGLQKKIIIFKNISSHSIQTQSGWKEKREQIIIENTIFVKFLCLDIFITRDQYIQHYDFMTKTLIYKFQLNQNCRITNTLFSDSSKLLILGLSNGNIIVYDLQEKQEKKEKQYDLTKKNSNTIIKGLSIAFLVETQQDIWGCLQSNKGIYKINKKNREISEVLLYENLQKFISISDTKVEIFTVDEKYSRFFLCFVTENIVRVYDFKSLNSLKFVYLMLPKKQHNKIQIEDQFYLFYSSSHLMIYDRQTLNFIYKIRRMNQFDIINSITIILNKYVVICFDTKFELFSLPSSTNGQEGVKFLDQQLLSFPIIIKYQVAKFSNSFLMNNSNGLKLQVIVLTKDKVIEQRYNLDYEELPIQDKKCEIVILVQTQIQMIQSFENIKPQTYADPTMRNILVYPNSNKNFYWMIILESGDMQQVNFQGTQESVVAIYSTQKAITSQDSIRELLINKNTLYNYKKEQINIRDYQLKFQFIDGKITFSEITKIVNLYKISIVKQDLSNISLEFKNMTQIVIKDFYINSVTRNSINQQPFLIFTNCYEVFIYELVIENALYDIKVFNNFFQANNVRRLVIQNIKIKNLQLDRLFTINNSEKLNINDLKIVNCQKSLNFDINDSQIVSQYLFFFVGVLNTLLDTFEITDCQNLQLLQTNKQYSDSNTITQLLLDTLDIQRFIIKNNQINQYDKINLLLLQNSFVNITNIQYINNIGNILIKNTQNIIISDGEFLSNQSTNGGSIAFSNCITQISINNSTFIKNKAYESGGAIFIEEFYGKISINQINTTIQNNSALIGGGMRIVNLHLDFPDSFYKNNRKIFINNSAELYGENFATFLNNIKIDYHYRQNSNNQETDLDSLNPDFLYINQQNLSLSESNLYSGIANINNFRSGGQVRLKITLTDHENQPIKFAKNKTYPKSIMEEINILSFKIEQNNTSDVFINGKNIITQQEYVDKENIFLFDDVIVTSVPNSKRDLLISYKISPSQLTRKPILMQISFRICLIGEVLKEIYTNSYSCFQCPLGFFSLEDPTKDEFWNKYILKQNVQSTQVNQIECQKCPDSAISCQSNQIKLKNGYWRSSNLSADIVQCNPIQNACFPEDTSSLKGCKLGYIGPACTECDNAGKIWKNKKFVKSYINMNTCEECSQVLYQILFIGMTIIVLLIYFTMSSIIFMNNFMHQQICQYLRFLELLPVSRNSIRDQSSFYLKILMNYIQITSALIFLQKSFFPDIITAMPNFLGSPGSRVIASLDCVINENLIEQYGHIHIVQFIYAVIPIFFCLIMVLLMKCLEKLKLFTIRKYHQYTLLNILFIFFQPDQISYFSQQLTCTKIGQKNYVTSDNTIDCGDQIYNYFAYCISIPLLLFWSLFPLVILFKLKQRSQQLSTCFTKYVYGYYYSEYNPKYYYWEFIRILLRVTIVVIQTLFSQFQLITQQVIILILFFYIKFTLHLYPIRNKNLQSFDIFCYQVIIFNAVLQQINSFFTSKILLLMISIIHYTYIFYIVIVIVVIKLTNPLSVIGRLFIRLLEKSISKQLFKKYIKFNIINMKSLNNWKLLKRNLRKIIQMKVNHITQKMNSFQEFNDKNIKLIGFPIQDSQKIEKKQSMNKFQANLYSNNNSFLNFIPEFTSERQNSEQKSLFNQNQVNKDKCQVTFNNDDHIIQSQGQINLKSESQQIDDIGTIEQSLFNEQLTDRQLTKIQMFNENNIQSSINQKNKKVYSELQSKIF